MVDFTSFQVWHRADANEKISTPAALLQDYDKVTERLGEGGWGKKNCKPIRMSTLEPKCFGVYT